MKRSFVDLHIHSRYSRATSKSLDPESIGAWAKIKGLDLVGTGDMTHPAWLSRLRETLDRGPEGFYRLKGQPEGTMFVPTGEVSAIYKQDGRTRKIHLVVVAPDLEAAEKFSQALGKVGNVTSDGRPILGLSARNILEIALTVEADIEVIPAHIWTPWFSLFGSKSGFEAVEECFGDLTGHIHALETGLSSDPEMNRLISSLDKYSLVSSSDAHSPEKLGREATVIEGNLDYESLKKAFRGGPNLIGTVEFFPEEGKYHLDGHADCGPPLSPLETKALKGLCPVCGKALTVGVLSRVMDLADREKAPEDRLPDWHLLSLMEVLSQTLNLGPTSKEVSKAYHRIVGEFGSEYSFLLDTPLTDIKDSAGAVLARAIERMRLGQVETIGGYDGKFGKIRVIDPRERLELSGQGLLFGAPEAPKRGRRKIILDQEPGQKKAPALVKRRAPSVGLLSDLSLEQQRAVTYAGAALALTAGPGAGKTMVLIRRAVFLIKNGAAKPENLLLTTYTRKAAETLAERLFERLGDQAQRAAVKTLHALALSLASYYRDDFSLASDDTLTGICAEAGKKCDLSPRRFQNLVTRLKNSLGFDQALNAEFDPKLDSKLDAKLEPNLETPIDPKTRSALAFYQKSLRESCLWDYDDLILEASKCPGLADLGPFSVILADEFQDFSLAQYAFFMKLVKNSTFTVIGDPDQSVYGFRGAHPAIFERLAEDRVDLAKMDLSLNYRSNPSICLASEALRPEGGPKRSAVRQNQAWKLSRAVLEAPASEANYVAKRIKAHLGATDLGPGGSHQAEKDLLPDLTLADIAVIFRLRKLGQEVAKALELEGLPYQMAGQEEERATDGLDFKADKISLLTMHAAKGLEFRLVFVIGLEEGLCPYHLDGQSSDPQEERRLFYVAMTRAKDLLYLTRASSRQVFGQRLSGKASPFWSQLPSYLCHDFVGRPAPQPSPAKKAPDPKLGRLF
ncbi:MAG: UvrD-helicase domain-containing protein [Deltaproteobacteria bacterium]|jgi:DNA helicase-2/ATP-dependent DNA helicase PcrA|nr:UvrD-helicase domain-containing protein [Deltaproteobacteria bacterium]